MQAGEGERQRAGGGSETIEGGGLLVLRECPLHLEVVDHLPVCVRALRRFSAQTPTTLPCTAVAQRPVHLDRSCTARLNK